MTTKLKTMAQQYGLTHLPKSKELAWETAYGSFQGYDVSMVNIHPQNGLIVQLLFTARPSGDVPVAESPAAFLARFAEEQKKVVKSATVQGNTMQVTMWVSTWKKVMASVGMVLNTVTGYLAANGFVSCCDRCGSTSERHLGAVGTLGCRTLCPECQQLTASEMEAQNTEVKSKKGNMLTGLVGAFLGSLVGVVVWVLIYQLGYIAAIGGLVMVVAVLKGYEIFGGRLSLGGTIACVVLSVVMLFLAHYSCYAFEVYKVLAAEYDVGFFECFQALPAFFEDGDLMTSVIGELVIGYLLMAVGGVSAIVSAFRKSNPNSTVVRLA